ncbi:MAG: class I adenylate-forming enzyme family protein [Myxococcota bacterium]|nr:class I adenylate-forming enzyme family protein [Myxococcota bacterium]
MPETLGQIVDQLALERPNDAAYWGPGPALSWRDYAAAGDRVARCLVEALELPRGERVAVLLPDGPGVHIALLGCEKAGIVAVGIGPRAGRREIEHLLGLTRARVLISRASHDNLDMAELVRSLAADGLPLTHHLEAEGELGVGDSLKVNGQRAPEALGGVETERAITAQELFLLNSTSGTTGMPKCVTHDQARWQAFHALAVEAGHLSPDDVFMSVVPAPFGFGIWTSHFTPTLLGAPCVVMPRFDAGEALALIERHRVSVLAAVSTQFIMMLEAAEGNSHDLDSLRVLFTGGEAVPYERAAAFEERTGARVLQFYGSNETGAVSGTRLEDSRDKRLRTAGRPIPAMNVRLFDEAGEDVTASRQGRPGCKGPTLSKGYYGDAQAVAEANAELIRADGWMMLGDQVSLDEDGYLVVGGRLDDFIIRGGKNISGPAVEEQVAEHPAVALAAAVAMPDPVFGERVCVYVELREGYADLELAELVAYLRGRAVSKETLPERLMVTPALPRGSGGKVAKQALRDDIRQRLADEFSEA